MRDWMVMPLRELLETTFAGEWGENPYPYNARVLRATDITDEMQVNLEGGALRFIHEIKLKEKRLIVGDIILEGSGGSIEKPVGRVAYFDGITSATDDFIVSNFFRTLRPNKEIIDPKFLYWLLCWFYKQSPLKAMQQQTTGIINLKLQQYLDALHQLPKCKTEQIKIAEILDSLNLKIRETEAIIVKLQQVKQGLLHDLLTRGVDENGELRPSYENMPELYQPSELGWIPKDWDVKTIEELGGFVTSGSRDWAQHYSDYGDLFIRIGNLTREHINFRFNKIQCVTPPKYGDGQRTKLVSGDILISITADLGIIGVMSNDIGTAYINQHVAMVRFASEEINPRFVGHFLGSKKFQALLGAKNDAGAKAGLNLPTVRSFPVLEVEKTEQDEITNRLDSMDKSIELERVNLNKLKLKKSGLMDDLLTGKVRVTKLINQQQAS